LIVLSAADLLTRGIDGLRAELPARWRDKLPDNPLCAVSVVAAALGGALPNLLDASFELTFGITTRCFAVATLLAWSPSFAWRGVLIPTAFAIFVALAARLDGELSAVNCRSHKARPPLSPWLGPCSPTGPCSVALKRR